MFDCVGYVFGSGLVFPIDKKKKSKRKKKEREEERGRGQGNQKRIQLHLLFSICSLGTDTADSSDQWPPEN